MRPTCKSAASVGDPELAFDVALHDAGVFLRDDLAVVRLRVLDVVHLAFAIWGIFAWKVKDTRPSV